MKNQQNRACEIKQADGEKEIFPMKGGNSAAKCATPEMGQIGGIA